MPDIFFIVVFRYMYVYPSMLELTDNWDNLEFFKVLLFYIFNF